MSPATERERDPIERAKTSLRAAGQAGLDRVQFWFDTFPRLLYHPLPWLGRGSSGRAEGTVARWRAIATRLDGLEARSALDVGCQAGYFALSLGERGIPTLGVDSDARSLRIARFAGRRARARNVGWLDLHVDETTVGLLPGADVVLLLSVWHHWVRGFGLEGADALLGALWERTGRVLFFETGEAEMPPEYGLPDLGADPARWLAGHLERRCPGGTVELLGRFKAFAEGGDEHHRVVHRHLFAVVRPAGTA